nr:phosphatidylinositol mannoside acyltransferase [Sinosporangium siamense]
MYSVAWYLVPRVPERLAAAVFRAIADRMWRRRGKSVLRLEKNLSRVVGKDPGDPAVRELSRAGLRSYFRYWLEVFRLPVMSRERIVTGMHSVDDHYIFDNVAAGRGVVLALPHMGNWDHAGAWLVHTGHPFTTVAERLKPESLFERWLAFRQKLGMEVLPLTAKDGGTAHAFGTLARRLRSGKVVCLPADRDLTNNGIEVEFFGEHTRMVAGPALLAIQTGAALHPASMWFEGGDWGLRIHPEIPVPEHGSRKEKVAAMTQVMADVFAEAIAKHPEDWHMLQRLWLADLDPRP